MRVGGSETDWLGFYRYPTGLSGGVFSDVSTQLVARQKAEQTFPRTETGKEELALMARREPTRQNFTLFA